MNVGSHVNYSNNQIPVMNMNGVLPSHLQAQHIYQSNVPMNTIPHETDYWSSGKMYPINNGAQQSTEQKMVCKH